MRLGFEVESGKMRDQKLPRPVLFDEMGDVGMSYSIDAYNKEHGIVMEVEAVRAIRANAIYKDLIQMSLMVDAHYAIIAMPLQYRYKSAPDLPYDKGKSILEAIYNSGRLHLPLQGIQLIGY